MANAPPFQAFRIEEFDLYRKERRRDRQLNEFRLVVRRKLDGLGKTVRARLRQEGLALECRASLHHPYIHNAYSVDSQWVYLSRSAKDRKALKQVLGPVGEDLDPNYCHLLFVVAIGEEGLEWGLRLHKLAWWDGQNLKKKAARREARQELCRLLAPLEGYALRNAEHRRRYACPEITEDDLTRFLEFYVPGSHWLHLSRPVPKEAPEAIDPELPALVAEELVRLVPAYTWIRWSPDNDHLFG